MLEKFFDGQAYITGNLAQEDGRDISSRMTRNGGPSPVRVAELLMTSFLASFSKTETLKNR